jgi:hypothetical protein
MFCFSDKDAALKSKYGCLGIGLDRYLDTAALEVRIGVSNTWT